MKYMLLIYGTPTSEPPLREAGQQMLDAYVNYNKAVADAGVYVSGDALQSVETATTVQVATGGERLVTDGPFAETREVLGGYYLLDVPDLDAAIDWAARCPGRAARFPDRGPADPGVRPVVTGGRAAGCVEDVFREEHSRLLATLVRQFGDLDLAEEVAADAIETALQRWPVDGVPGKPAAWLLTTARRRAIDVLRRNRSYATRLALLQVEADRSAPATLEPGEDVPDERLRLFFTCCHPALPLEAQTALTLRCLAGLDTPEVARAFLLPTVDRRAAHRAGQAQDPRRAHPVPRARGGTSCRGGCRACCACCTSIFTEGYAASAGDDLVRVELADEAIRLARILHRLLPAEREVAGLLALLLLVDARRAARTGPAGELVLLAEQDRSRWDTDRIAEGRALLQVALPGGSPGPYAVQAAIAAVHDEAPDAAATDWPQVVALYDVLARVAPSPLVELNRAVAVAMRDGPAAGLALLDALADDPRLRGYHLLPAARADLLRRLGRRDRGRRPPTGPHSTVVGNDPNAPSCGAGWPNCERSAEHRPPDDRAS